jgi:hypothetical protein
MRAGRPGARGAAAKARARIIAVAADRNGVLINRDQTAISGQVVLGLGLWIPKFAPEDVAK